MGRLVALVMGLCLAGSALGQLPKDDLACRQWIDQHQAQRRQEQLHRSRRELEQQQQLNQERLRAEEGWQLHPRPQAPWEERRREEELRKEFQRAQ
jgi:hypothetical protein